MWEEKDDSNNEWINLMMKVFVKQLLALPGSANYVILILQKKTQEHRELSLLKKKQIGLFELVLDDDDDDLVLDDLGMI